MIGYKLKKIPIRAGSVILILIGFAGLFQYSPVGWKGFSSPLESISFILFLLSLFSIISGMGLFFLKKWARSLAIDVYVIMLFLSTLFNIYMYWFSGKYGQGLEFNFFSNKSIKYGLMYFLALIRYPGISTIPVILVPISIYFIIILFLSKEQF